VTRSGTRKPSDPLELQLAGVSTPAAGSNGKTAPVKRASPARTPTKKAQSVTARKRPAAGEP
jgi:hypothetical protein